MVSGAMGMSIGFYNNQNICFICMRLSKKYLNESDKKGNKYTIKISPFFL